MSARGHFFYGREKSYWKTTTYPQFAWGIHTLWFIVFVIQTRRSRALSSARGDLRTNIPFYFRHVPNQSWLLCCRGKCLFQVKQTDTSGPSLSLLFTARPSISPSEWWKGAKPGKNRRWSGWKKVNYFSPFVLSLFVCLSFSLSFLFFPRTYCFFPSLIIPSNEWTATLDQLALLYFLVIVVYAPLLRVSCSVHAYDAYNWTFVYPIKADVLDFIRLMV